MTKAQTHWSMEFLQTVYSQPNVEADSMILSQLSSEKYRSPIVRDVDLRLRSNRLTPEIEELRMRFDLMNPAMISADKKYQVALKSYQEIRTKVRINEYLLERYQLLIGHYQRRRMITNLEDLLSIYQGLLERSGTLYVREALKVDKEILRLSREIEDLRLKQTFLEEELQMNFYDEAIKFSWDQFQFVKVEEIMEELAHVMEIPMQDVELIINRDRLASEELHREQKQSRRSLGFIQPEYVIDASNDFADNLSFQVGIQLPIFDEDRVDRKLDEMELQKDLADSEDDIQELQKLVSKIWLSAEYFKEDLQLITAKKDQLAQFSDELVSTDRELMFDLLEYKTDINEMELRSKMDLLRIYVQAMALSGDLARPPLRNFLESK